MTATNLLDAVGNIDDIYITQAHQKQNSILKHFNTVSRRIAAFLIILLIATTSTVIAVDDLRKPMIDFVEKIFSVNAQDMLIGTNADTVAPLFPTDVARIISTSFVSQSHHRAVIRDEKKIAQFIELLSETTWRAPGDTEDPLFGDLHPYWSFDFLDAGGESVCKLDMCNDTISNMAKVRITSNGQEWRYYIASKTYAEILAFTSKTYYLRSATRPLPEKELCVQRYEQAVEGLSEEQIKQIKSTVREIHYAMETFLLNNVSLLKEYDSVYWQYAISGDVFIDPISGYEHQLTCYENILSGLKAIEETTANSGVKWASHRAFELWDNAMQNHDLDGLFKAHEYVHDCDYFILNYPTKYVYDTKVDFDGPNYYYGNLDQ